MPRPADRPPLEQVLPKDYEDPEATASARNPVEVMRGVNCWKNKDNGFAVMTVRYDADPDKCPEVSDYEERMAKQMGGYESADFQRFFRLNWKVRSGEKVFPEFISKLGHPTTSHVIKPMPIPAEWSRRRGLDPAGRNPFAVGWWALSPERILFCYDELYVSNAGELRLESPQGWVTSLNAMKYLIWRKSQNQVFERTVIDPTSRQKSLLSFGPESGRVSILVQMEQKPYAIPCDPARRRGLEYIEIEYLRGRLFTRRHYPKLSAETMEILGLQPQAEGYELFGAYLMGNCSNHIREFSGLLWEETENPDVNKPEEVMDVDNHTFDATKYVLSADWEPSNRRPVKVLKDHRAAQADRSSKALEEAGRELEQRQNEGLDDSDLLAGEA